MAEKLPFKVGDRVRYLPNNGLYTVKHIDPEPKGTPAGPRNVFLQNQGKFIFNKGELMAIPVALVSELIGEVKATGGPLKTDVPEKIDTTEKE